jgi:hypothetical protein
MQRVRPEPGTISWRSCVGKFTRTGGLSLTTSGQPLPTRPHPAPAARFPNPRSRCPCAVFPTAAHSLPTDSRRPDQRIRIPAEGVAIVLLVDFSLREERNRADYKLDRTLSSAWTTPATS